jgi:rhodanese-related sulfurtransferase
MKSVSKDEVAAQLGSGKMLVVNVLAPPAYDIIHIKGSIPIPLSELKNGRWRELDKGKEIVVHCSSYSCDASREAADFLESKGFNVRAYEGGIREWAEAGLPMEGSIPPQQYLVQRYGKSAATAPKSTR